MRHALNMKQHSTPPQAHIGTSSQPCQIGTTQFGLLQEPWDPGDWGRLTEHAWAILISRGGNLLVPYTAEGQYKIRYETALLHIIRMQAFVHCASASGGVTPFNLSAVLTDGM